LTDVGNSAYYLAISADGRRAISVSASAARNIRLWDLDSGRALDVIEYPDTPIAAFAASGDATRAIFSLLDGTFCIWDYSRKTLRRFGSRGDPSMGLAIDQAGNRAVALSTNGILTVIDV